MSDPRTFKQILAHNFSLFLEQVNCFWANLNSWLFRSDGDNWAVRLFLVTVFLGVLLAASQIKSCADREQTKHRRIDRDSAAEEVLRRKACGFAGMAYINHDPVKSSLTCLTKTGEVVRIRTNVEKRHLEVTRSSDNEK